MKKVLFATALAIALMAPAFAGTGNWVTNGDFENGLNGWTTGTFQLLLQPTAFDTAGEVLQQKYDGTWGDPATALAPHTGTSVGWARYGTLSADNWTYVSQIVDVAPGTYNVDQSVTMWNVIAGTSDPAYNTRFAAMFLFRVDDQIGMPYSGSDFTFRSTKWDFQDPAHQWAVKNINGGAASSFTTTQGRVQFILAFEDHAKEDTGARYGYAAFDNLVFETYENPVIPEPGSLLALGSGLVGLAGMVIRRRK